MINHLGSLRFILGLFKVHSGFIRVQVRRVHTPLIYKGVNP